MKKANFLLATLMLSAIWSSAWATEPKDVVAAFHAALAAGDKAKAESFLAPEVVIFESGFVERSRAEYAGHHLSGDIAFVKNRDEKVTQQTVRTEGPFAAVWQETESVGRPGTAPQRLIGTETMLLEKRGDTWLIVHIHWSSRKAK